MVLKENPLPSTAEVDIYGTSRSEVDSRFTGTQFERLNSLATTLRGKVLWESIDFHPRDRGDNGLDIVAWIPLGDEATAYAFFARCALRSGLGGQAVRGIIRAVEWIYPPEFPLHSR